MTTFNKLYKHYKDNFDLELRLKASNTTYAEVKNPKNGFKGGY